MNRRLMIAAAACALLGVSVAAAAPQTGAWGIALGDQDRGVQPGDDFYRYQNGGWFDRTSLAPGKNSAWWQDVRRMAPARLVGLLKEAAADRSLNPDSPEGKAAAFYRAYADRALVEQKGLAPLKPELDAILAAGDHQRMARLDGWVEGPGTTRDGRRRVPIQRGLFSVNIGQDPQHPDRYAVFIGQGGMLLPGPEFYTDPKLADIKGAYQAYAADMLRMIGWPEPERRAAEIVAYETRVAEVSWTHEQMLDAKKTINPMSTAELERLAPDFDWQAYFAGAGLSGLDHVVIDARDAFPALARVFANTPVEVLQARQALAAADNGAQLLPDAVSALSFAFRAGKLNGFGRQGADDVIEASAPDLLGRLYVKRYFSAETKARVEEMAGYIRQGLDRRLQRVAWMSPATRTAARAKLARLQIHVGYPEHFDDYRGLVIRDDDLYGDVARAADYVWRQQVSGLGKPYDRDKWVMTPEYPNYNFRIDINAIELPASLLVAPFFDPDADAAVNYGAVGTLIGQIMMLSIDDRGGLFDTDGKLRPWWTAEDTRRFEALKQRIVTQYSRLEALPGLHVNGALVAGEAMDDQGGILAALDGYHLWLKGRKPAVLDGYSGDQRFFLGRAQMWRAKFGEPFIRNQIATGSNAPPFVRVNGTAPNIDAWYAAFAVKPGQRMYLAPQERVRIW